mgnify:CR=1 FL=1
MALTDSLISYWKLDESSGNAADSEGSNTLTNNNTTPFVAAKINNGADLEATSNQSFSITDAAQTGLDITGDFSFQAWVKLESAATGFSYGLIDKRSGTIGQYTILIRDVDSDGGRDIAVIFRDASNNESDGDARNAGYVVGTFAHIVVTVDVSAGADGIVVYVDNVSKAFTVDTNLATSIGNNTGAFFLGDAVTVGTVPLDGILDECGIWSRILTAAEVSELYNGGAGLAYPFTAAAAANHWLLMGV